MLERANIGFYGALVMDNDIAGLEKKLFYCNVVLNNFFLYTSVTLLEGRCPCKFSQLFWTNRQGRYTEKNSIFAALLHLHLEKCLFAAHLTLRIIVYFEDREMGEFFCG